MTTLRTFVRQRARRDALQVTVWVGGTAALAAAGYPGIRGSYGDEQERAGLLATAKAMPQPAIATTLAMIRNLRSQRASSGIEINDPSG